MTQETKEAEVTQVTQAEPPKPSAEELVATISKLEAQVEEAKREAKSHQEYGRRTKQELEKQQGLDTKVTRLEKILEVQTEMVAALLDKEEGVEEQPKRKSEQYRSRLAQTDVTTKETQDQEFKRKALEADGLLKSVGLTMKDSPETLTAYVNFLEGNAEAGLEEVRKIVTTKQTKVDPPKAEEPKIDIKKAIEEGVQAALKARGLLDSDNGTPGGSPTSAQQAMQDYISGKITSDEATKRGVNFN